MLTINKSIRLSGGFKISSAAIDTLIFISANDVYLSQDLTIENTKMTTSATVVHVNNGVERFTGNAKINYMRWGYRLFG